MFAIGENAQGVTESNASAYRKFLADIARPFAAAGAKVVMRSPFWINAVKAECTANAAAKENPVEKASVAFSEMLRRSTRIRPLRTMR